MWLLFLGDASIVIATGVCWALNLDVPTIESRFGQLPRTLPMPYFDIDLGGFSKSCRMRLRLPFGGIESLLSAVIADTAIGSRHKLIAN